MIIENIEEIIGNTPLYQIPESFHEKKGIRIFVKLEYLNPFGSVKDRTALGLLRSVLKENPKVQSIIESSSGNTAKALQMLCAVRGLSFTSLSNRIRLQETKDTLQLLGAVVEELPGRSDCFDPRDPNDPVRIIERRVSDAQGELATTSQYFNQSNEEMHYHTTGLELIDDLPRIDCIFGALGTTGSSQGMYRRVKERDVECQLVGIATASNDLIPGMRRLDEMFEVGLFKKNLFSDVLEVTSSQSVEASLKLIRNQGLLVGPSTGALFHGILRWIDANAPKEGTTIVMLACDGASNYLSYYKEKAPEAFGRTVSEKPMLPTEDELLNVTEVEPMQPEVQSYVVIDTRSHAAFKLGHIKGSLNIPDQVLEESIVGSRLFPKDSSLLFVCPYGDRSKLWAHFYKRLGYSTASLKGGMSQWREKGNPVERELKARAASH